MFLMTESYLCCISWNNPYISLWYFDTVLLSICSELMLILVKFGLSIDNGLFFIEYGKINFLSEYWFNFLKRLYLLLLLYWLCLVLGKVLFDFCICLFTGLFSAVLHISLLQISTLWLETSFWRRVYFSRASLWFRVWFW